MTTDIWLLAICAGGIGMPMLLGVLAHRMRPRPVPIQRRPVKRSIER